MVEAVRACPGMTVGDVTRLLDRAGSVDQLKRDLLVIVVAGCVYPGPRRVIFNLKSHKEYLTESSDSGIIELLDNQ